MWFKWMILAFITNGLSQFGARMLQAEGLANTHAFLYLAFWYTSGLVVALLTLALKRNKITRQEVIIGAVMGLFSSLGWLCFTAALGHGFQGYLAFPLAIGGSMSVVSAVGILFFKERLTGYGYLGVLCGILGIVVLVTA